jgi:hypothetical protein
MLTTEEEVSANSLTVSTRVTYSGITYDNRRVNRLAGAASALTGESTMSTASVIGDAQQQVVDVSRSMIRLSWAMTVLGAQQAANMMLPSKMAKSGDSLAAALDAMTSAIEGQFGNGLKSAYRTGSVFAMAPLDGLPSFEVTRAMQGLAMQPVFFEPLRVMMPPLAASVAAFIPGHDAGIVRRECEAKMEVMQLVQDVRKICPDKSVYIPLPETVAKGYALGSFPALWAVEGIGHDLVTSRHHRGEALTALLTSKDIGKLPDGSLTMLHAGIGLGLAEIALKDLRPDSPPERLDSAIDRFVADCRSSSRNGYLGCALESLGLVTRHFYGHSMVLAIDKRLEGKDAALRGFFWHGVGRAVYFSPENLVPSLGSPWPAVAMCERLGASRRGEGQHGGRRGVGHDDGQPQAAGGARGIPEEARSGLRRYGRLRQRRHVVDDHAQEHDAGRTAHRRPARLRAGDQRRPSPVAVGPGGAAIGLESVERVLPDDRLQEAAGRGLQVSIAGRAGPLTFGRRVTA